MFRTALALAALLAANTASAGLISSVNLKMTGFAYGYAAVQTNVTSGTIGDGELQGLMTNNGVTSSFLTYCTDLAQSFSWNTNYSYTLVANGSANGFTARQADLLGKLYTLAGRDVDTTDESAAFQLAVWEIVTESASNKLNILNGNFQLTAGASNQQRSLASNWLESISASTAKNTFDATRLYSSVAQDFVVFTERSLTTIDGGKVPEPASYGLVGMALLGLVATRRHRAQAQTHGSSRDGSGARCHGQKCQECLASRASHWRGFCGTPARPSC